MNMTSKECMSVSLFSEWIAATVMTHHEFGYKIAVICMGSMATEALSDATSAYPSMNSGMSLTSCVNPAIVDVRDHARHRDCDLVRVPVQGRDHMAGVQHVDAPEHGDDRRRGRGGEAHLEEVRVRGHDLVR